MLEVARDYASGRWTRRWRTTSVTLTSPSTTPTRADECGHRRRLTGTEDPALAAKWAALEACPSGSLGRIVWDFYQKRGFAFPGTQGAVSPLLAQHDWVHCLADDGTSATGEIEVFTFLASAIPDAKGFTYAVMIIGLFETGYVGGVPASPALGAGHLRSREVPCASPTPCGAGLALHIDVMGGIDWFEYRRQTNRGRAAKARCAAQEP